MTQKLSQIRTLGLTRNYFTTNKHKILFISRNLKFLENPSYAGIFKKKSKQFIQENQIYCMMEYFSKFVSNLI